MRFKDFVHDIRKDMPGIVFGQNENTRYSQELVDAYKREILIRKEKAPRIKLAVCVEKVTGKSPEKLYDLPEEPQHNCPLINAYVRKIKNHLKTHRPDKTTQEELTELLDVLEEIRSRFKALRHWGDRWRKVALKERLTPPEQNKP
jgi:hypothetical protein